MTHNLDRFHLWMSFAKLDDSGDIEGSIAYILDTDLKNDSLAQRHVGWANVQKGDMSSAGTWYLKAARQEDQEAIEDCYEFAKLLDMQDEGEALALFVENPPLLSLERFQRLMVSHYYRRAMMSKVLEWSIILARNNGEDDLLYVGKLYLSSGQPENAESYLRRAAASGNGEANELMGEMYWQGLGVPQDQKRAATHYNLGAKQGFILSQSRLLHIERRHRGVWHLPKFAFGVIRLALKARILHARNPKDPRLELLNPEKPLTNGAKGCHGQ